MRIALDGFDLRDMTLLGGAIRACTETAVGLEAAAQRVVEKLDELIGQSGSEESGLVLSRLYVTRRVGKLDGERAAFVRGLASEELDQRTPCLALMGSYGREPDWCGVHQSRGPVAIPLLGIESLERQPLVWRLFQQAGLDMGALQ
ncbi:MAG: hypothetical protein FJW36_21915 [Acidobacteria bacterium]|nr:hypothetical protein [Acidobacteriota bacterium]